MRVLIGVILGLLLGLVVLDLLTDRSPGGRR